MSRTYGIEVERAPGSWVTLLAMQRLDYARGYLHGRDDAGGLRLAMRLVDSDGRVVDSREARGLDIGQIAGWPTAEQYERAAAEAMERARRIRERERDTLRGLVKS